MSGHVHDPHPESGICQVAGCYAVDYRVYERAQEAALARESGEVPLYRIWDGGEARAVQDWDRNRDRIRVALSLKLGIPLTSVRLRDISFEFGRMEIRIELSAESINYS